LTFRPDDYDLVADELAGAVIVFPVFRNKDFEERAGTKSRSRRAGEPDQMLGEVVWNQFRVPGFCNNACRQRKVSRDRILALTKSNSILSPAHNFVFISKKIREPDSFILRRCLWDQRFGRRLVAGRNSGGSLDVVRRNEIASNNRLRLELFQCDTKGIITGGGSGKQAVESDNLCTSADETLENHGVDFAVPRPPFAHDLEGAVRSGIA